MKKNPCQHMKFAGVLNPATRNCGRSAHYEIALRGGRLVAVSGSTYCKRHALARQEPAGGLLYVRVASVVVACDTSDG